MNLDTMVIALTECSDYRTLPPSKAACKSGT